MREGGREIARGRDLKGGREVGREIAEGRELEGGKAAGGRELCVMKTARKEHTDIQPYQINIEAFCRAALYLEGCI